MIWDKGREEWNVLPIVFDRSCAKSNIGLMGRKC
jgi:hypothetical protein